MASCRASFVGSVLRFAGRVSRESRSRGSKPGAALQRQPAPRRGRQPLRARAEQAPARRTHMVTASPPRASPGARPAERRSRASSRRAPRELPAQPRAACAGDGGLAPAVDLAQAPPLVEAAAQLLQRRVGVGVPHRGRRHERLGVAGAQHVDREHAILGVGNLAKRHALPGARATQALASVKKPRRADQARSRQARARPRPGAPRAARRPGRARRTSAPARCAPATRCVGARAVGAVDDPHVVAPARSPRAAAPASARRRARRPGSAAPRARPRPRASAGCASRRG